MKFEKPFDKVRWGNGFNTISVKKHGLKRFYLKKYVRPGCPLVPLLFAITKYSHY
eukprot:c3171_g2_i1 orf=237-401(+)